MSLKICVREISPIWSVFRQRKRMPNSAGRHIVSYHENRLPLGYVPMMSLFPPSHSLKHNSRAEHRPHSLNFLICIRRMPRICPKSSSRVIQPLSGCPKASSGVIQPLSGHFMTRCFQSEANQSHNTLALLSFVYTVVEAFLLRCSTNYRDRKIQSLVRCHRKNQRYYARR